MKKTVVELFAGVGGFHLGLSKASDFDIVWANQWEPNKKVQHAFNCYSTHFSNETKCINEDISLAKEDVPNHTLLVGGFPCQDYSVASTGAKGIEGKKGVLWWEINDIVEKNRPPFILLENVDRLLKSPTSQRGRDFGVMLSCLNTLGYSVEWRVLNAAEYGFSQRRRRVFIFAYHNSTEYFKKQDKIESINILRESGFFANSFEVEYEFNISETSIKNETLLETSDTFSFSFANGGYMKDGVIYSASLIPVFKEPLHLESIMEKTVDEKYFITKSLEKWEYLKGSKKIERTAKTGHKYTFSEGSIAFPDPTNRPARTMLTSESSINRSTHVVKDLSNENLRLLTPIECERLNGFEDNWTNTGMPEKFRYFCMGNALVVNLVEIMGKQISKIIESEK